MPNLSSYVQSISYTAKSSLSISLAFTMCLGVVGCRDQHSSDATTSTTPTAPSTLKILHINDHHSHLDEEQMELSIDNDQGQSTTYTVSRGGFARVAALIKQLETKTEPQLKLHAGDATTGDLYYTLSKGQADADLMNTVCFDAFTIGNHEFDGKDEGLKHLSMHWIGVNVLSQQPFCLQMFSLVLLRCCTKAVVYRNRL